MVTDGPIGGAECSTGLAQRPYSGRVACRFAVDATDREVLSANTKRYCSTGSLFLAAN